MVYVGLAARYIVDVEALNMAESVGNVVRHKKAPVIVRTKDGYEVRYLPVVSGESIAHGYQELLARLAGESGLPVCPLCSLGVFVKHGGDEIINRVRDRYRAAYANSLYSLVKSGEAKKQPEKFIEDFESTVISSCVVEDVGGFLYPGAVPVKRTSKYSSSYMVPSRAHIKASAVEALFHVRHDPLQVTGEEEAGVGQAIYYVEVSSSVYTVSMGLDLDYIGCHQNASGGWSELGDAARRREIALRALALLVDGLRWGAKKSRFNPIVEVESVVVTVSHPLSFNPAPGHEDDYIVETVRGASGFLETIKGVADKAYVDVYYYVNPRGTAEKPDPSKAPEGVTVKEAGTPAKAVLMALERLGDSGCRG